MTNREIGLIQDSLGVKLLNRNLEIMAKDYKVETLLELLNTVWNSGNKGSTALIAPVLIGNVF